MERHEKLTKHGLLGPSFGPSDEADIQFIGGFLKIQENWGQPGQKTPASSSLNSKWIEGLDSGLDLDIQATSSDLGLTGNVQKINYIHRL